MLSLSHVSKQYGGRTVVRDLSISVKKGQVFGFLGANGAGKTTTMKMIVGLAEPDEGTINVDGHALTAAAKQRIGFMPEGPYFYENLSGLEFLVFCAGLFERAQTDSEKLRALLKRVGLEQAAGRHIRTYSKGMRQRLGFAQALVNNPEYVFLDEPLDGLDPLGRREIKEIVAGMHNEGKTVFLNSHILSDIEEMCDVIGVIHAGTLIYSGPVADFCRGLPLEQQFVKVISRQPKTHE